MTDMTRDIPDNVRNVLVIMTDQHRTDTIGCLGNPHAHTPVIDAMGESGFAFTHCFTPTAICTPARASLMTGKRPGKHQVLANPEWNIAYQVSIPKGTWTYTQELRDAGYNVGIVGKYHCGYNLPDAFGADDDTYWGAENPVANEKYVAWLEANNLPPVRAHDLWRGKLPGGRDGHIIAARLDQPEEATFERFLADRAIEKLSEYAADWKDSGQPFCLDVHFFGPHLPYFLPDEWFDLIDPDLVELPENFGDPLIGKPPIQENYATYWSTSSFTNEQWKKLIAVYWGYTAMIDYEIGRIMDVARELGIPGRHGGLLLRGPRGVHGIAPPQRQGPDDVRRHLQRPLYRPHPRRVHGGSLGCVRLPHRLAGHGSGHRGLGHLARGGWPLDRGPDARRGR